jgi:hypothetical protein
MTKGIDMVKGGVWHVEKVLEKAVKDDVKDVAKGCFDGSSVESSKIKGDGYQMDW